MPFGAKRLSRTTGPEPSALIGACQASDAASRSAPFGTVKVVVLTTQGAALVGYGVVVVDAASIATVCVVALVMSRYVRAVVVIFWVALPTFLTVTPPLTVAPGFPSSVSWLVESATLLATPLGAAFFAPG